MDTGQKCVRVGFFTWMFGASVFFLLQGTDPAHMGTLLWIPLFYMGFGIMLEAAGTLWHRHRIQPEGKQGKIEERVINLPKQTQTLLLDLYCLADNAGETQCPRCQAIVKAIEDYLKGETDRETPVKCEICGEEKARVSSWLREQFGKQICLTCEPEIVRPLFEKTLSKLCELAKLATADFIKKLLSKRSE